MEGPSPIHAADHSIYNNPLERLQAERRQPVCALPREKCYQLAVEQRIWYITELHLEATPQVVNIATESEGVTALMKFGYQPSWVEYLIDLGADVHMQNIEGDTALMYILKHANLKTDNYEVRPDTVKILIDAGANVHLRDNNGVHVINYAARLGRLSKFNIARIVELLLAEGVNIEELGSDMDLVLIRAVRSRSHINLVKNLIELGANVNVSDDALEYYAPTALMVAVIHSGPSTEVMKMLIDAGADINAPDKTTNCSALMYACNSQFKQNLELTKFLLEEGANLNAVDENGKSVLIHAISNRNFINLEVVKFLIDSGANVNHCTLAGSSVLTYAKTVEVVRILLDAGADVHAKNKSGYSVLNNVIMDTWIFNLDVVKALVDAGASVIDNNHTVIHSFIQAFNDKHFQNEMLPILKYLLDLPQIKQNLQLICTGDNNPQKLLKGTTRMSHYVCLYKAYDLEFFQLMLQLKIMDTKYLQLEEISYPAIEPQSVMLGGISYFLMNYMDKRNKMKPYVQALLDAGFDVLTGDVSPLTIFLLDYDYTCFTDEISTVESLEEYLSPTNQASEFLDLFINHGVHVEQQILTLIANENLQALRKQLYLPDALFSALYNGHLWAVRQLLPYWCFPGLYLLLFAPLYAHLPQHEINQLCLMLMKHGERVPHGTPMWRQVARYFETVDPMISDAFQSTMSSPRSLRELCRYQVRASLAAQASRPGPSLPQLLRDISPPGMDFLLM